MASFAAILEAELAKGEPAVRVSRSAVPDFSMWMPVPEPVRPAAPAWARTLDAPFPCSERELRSAFKQRAFATHPDRTGGTAAAFLEAKQALEVGLRAIAERRSVGVGARAVDRYRHA